MKSIDVYFCNYLEKLVIDESQEANVNNDSYIWLRLVKGMDTLINTTKMPVSAEYGV